MFRNYCKVSWRNLQRNKVFSFINIAGLSLGLACAMLILLYVKDEVSYDRFHKNVASIYRIVSQTVNASGGNLDLDGNSGYLQGPRFQAAVPDILSFVRYRDGEGDIKNGNDVQSQQIFFVDSNFFSVFTFPLISGNPRTALIEAQSAVISEDLAKRQFGKTDPMGKIISIKTDSTFTPYVVTGVARKCPQNSSIKFDILLPVRVPLAEASDNTNWFNFFLNTFVVLRPGADTAIVQARMNAFYQQDAKSTIQLMAEKYGVKGLTSYLLQPFTDMHLNKYLPASNGLTDSSNPVFSYILTGIALFILLIACINFVNLTLARSLKRAREIGIRKTVGGNRKQLIFQFLGESFLLCLAAFVLGLIIVQLLLPVFNDLSNKALSLSYLMDIKLICAYFALFILTGLLAGFYPALVLSAYDPVKTLYNRFNLSGRNYLQKILVIIQFALASFLIIGTFTIYRQFNYLTTEKLGYDDSHLITVNESMNRGQARLFRQELLKNPDIIEMAPKNGGMWGTVAKVNGDSILQFAYETVNETFLPLLKIPLVEGRNFSADYPSDSNQSVLVNESFVRKAGWKKPIGQEVNFWYRANEKYRVIGVVKDFHFQSLNQTIDPELFTMKLGNSYGMAFIKIKAGTETASLSHIQKTFKKLFPISPYSYQFKDQENLKYYEAEAKWKQILLFGALLTIFISTIGLFGLSVLSTQRRTKEIGIRKVLGASLPRVVALLSKDFLLLVVLALLIATPFARIYANKWLQNYPYRISLGWGIFAMAALLVVAIALVTVSFQSIKAARTNPAKSLRTDA
jgi:putative ABC transport system permease protein